MRSVGNYVQSDGMIVIGPDLKTVESPLLGFGEKNGMLS